MSIFGGTFKPYVVRQLEARQSLVSSGETTFKRSRNVQQYTSAKTAWVKMASFVNYSSNPNDPSIKPDDKLARKYVLSAGTLVQSPTDDTQFALRAGIGNPSGAYGSPNIGNRQLGLRPMPGIESVSVVNKGAYGSLRQTTVKFRCWDKRQLDDLEILYMRVGYPVLVEWGWSLYIDTFVKGDDYNATSNKGTVKVSSADLARFSENDLKPFNDPTINPFDVNKDLPTLYDDIMRKNHEFSGNYDGMVGIIQNFEWELLPNGSYACTTTLISMGDALDSIKMNRPVSINKGANNNVDSAYKTSFTQLMEDLTFKNIDGKAVLDKYLISQDIKDNPGLDKTSIALTRYGNVPSTSTYPSYVQFSYFIALLNYRFNLLSNGKPFVNIELPIYNQPGNRGNGLCLASVDSVSIDPSVCIIRNTKATWITGISGGYALKDEFGVDIEMRKYLIEQEASDFHNLGQIGNIYFNVQYLTDVFNQEINDSSDGEVHIYSFLKKVLTGASKALGSVNDFDLYVTDSTAVVIDKHYTELPSESARSKKFQLNIFGIDSVVRGFKIVSKIFQSQASMIAISAGSKLNLGGVNSSTQQYFNKGLSNRLYPELTTEDTQREFDSEKKAKLAIASNVLELRGYLQSFLVKESFPAAGESIASANTILNTALLNVNSDVNYRSVVPITVEVTLDGIAGIAVGEVFTLNTDMLPEDYNRKDLGFIVTGLRHDIVKSDWLTVISAYVILLDQEDSKKNKANTSLTGNEKAAMEALFSDVITETKNRYNKYCDAYLELLYFVKTFYENRLRMQYVQTKYYQDLRDPSKTYTEQTKPKALGNFETKYKAELKRLELDPEASKSLSTLAVGVNKIIGEVNLPYPNGTLLLNNYTFVKKGDVLPNVENTSYVHVLDNYLNEDGRQSASIKKMITEMVNKSSGYKELAGNAESAILAEDVIKVINEVHSTSASSIFTKVNPYYASVDQNNRVEYKRGDTDSVKRSFTIKYGR